MTELLPRPDPLSLADLSGRSVLLAGAGIDNRALLPHLLAVGPTSVVCEADDLGAVAPQDSDALAAAGVSLVATGAAPEVDVVVRAPGWSPYRDDVTQRRIGGAEVTTAMALWFATWPGRTIAITGTKGKSTTTSLIGRALTSGDVEHAVAGNIGDPVWAVQPSTDLVVVEVSSYQACEIAVAPTVGVLTSLSADHLSWHGGQERYVDDKLRLFERISTGSPVLHPGSATTTQELRARKIPERCVAPAEVGLDGAHNAANAGLAVAAIEAATDFDPELARGAIKRADALPGRLCRVADDGRIWIDDTLASNPTGAAAGVDAFPERDVVLIVGGDDRSVDPHPLVAALGRRAESGVSTHVIGLTDTTAPVARAGVGVPGVTCVEAEDIEGAVLLAHSLAAKGAVVLFSPGAPTPPAQGAWRDRGRRFSSAIAGLAGPGRR